MNEELNQKISQFLDNELDHDKALSLLQKMHSQPELIDTKNRYEAISHALKTDVFLTVSTDFSAKISKEIQNEPLYLLPRYKKPVKRLHKAFAVAASIAVVAVLAAQSLNNPAERVKTSSILQLAQNPPSHEPPSKSGANSNKAEQYPLNARINDYLQAHDSSVYTNGEVNLRPLTRVTAYDQE